jgi:small subunit ribosomal protein S7
MIPVARRAATRSFGHWSRSLSTIPSQTKSNTVQDTLNALGSLMPGAEAVFTPVIEPAPVRPTTKSNLTPILNIPPAEDPLLAYLTALLTKSGHRARAARIVSRTLLHIHTFTRAPPLPILRKAVIIASPAVKCLSHRHGAKNVAKPVPLGEKQRTRFALRWIIKASDSKSGQTMEERLAREFIAVIDGSSNALKEKGELHKHAMVNRYVPLPCSVSRFIHYSQGEMRKSEVKVSNITFTSRPICSNAVALWLCFGTQIVIPQSLCQLRQPMQRTSQTTSSR